MTTKTLPHDVIDAADKAVKGAGVILGIADFNILSEHLARALLAERERCAGIAEMHDHRGDIAAAIRRSA